MPTPAAANLTPASEKTTAASAENGLMSIPVASRASRLAKSLALLAPAGIAMTPNLASAKAMVGIESAFGPPTAPTLTTIEERRSTK